MLRIMPTYGECLEAYAQCTRWEVLELTVREAEQMIYS